MVSTMLKEAGGKFTKGTLAITTAFMIWSLMAALSSFGLALAVAALKVILILFAAYAAFQFLASAVQMISALASNQQVYRVDGLLKQDTPDLTNASDVKITKKDGAPQVSYKPQNGEATSDNVLGHVVVRHNRPLMAGMVIDIISKIVSIAFCTAIIVFGAISSSALFSSATILIGGPQALLTFMIGSAALLFAAYEAFSIVGLIGDMIKASAGEAQSKEAAKCDEEKSAASFSDALRAHRYDDVSMDTDTKKVDVVLNSFGSQASVAATAPEQQPPAAENDAPSSNITPSATSSAQPQNTQSASA